MFLWSLLICFFFSNTVFDPPAPYFIVLYQISNTPQYWYLINVNFGYYTFNSAQRHIWCVFILTYAFFFFVCVFSDCVLSFCQICFMVNITSTL